MKLIHEYSTIHPSDFLYLECRPIDFILFLFQRKTTKTAKKCMFASCRLFSICSCHYFLYKRTRSAR